MGESLKKSKKYGIKFGKIEKIWNKIWKN